jgi:hypothetical protein
MNRTYLLPAAAAIALLGACEAHVGNDAAPVDANSTAENRAENGRVSIEAPGFSLKVDVPESILSRADMDSDNPLFYPGAAFGGIHVQGARDVGGEDQVELRFTTSDAIDRVAAWYRDLARRRGFTVATDNREGEAIVLAGTAQEDRDPFTLRLTPRGGGTEARLLLTDRD